MRNWLFFCVSAVMLGVAACQSSAPMATVPHVDMPRFMGDWYVIANIPSYVELGAHNAVESYALNADGSVSTTFTFRADSFAGELKTHTPTGFVVDRSTNATWGMQFIWPIKADYRIIYLADDYSLTVIGREKRDYVWIMARKPVIADADYQRMVQFAGAQGYDIKKIEKVPQQWSQ